MGVWASSCLGGAQYSLPEQANLTLIFFPKIVGEGGEVTKIFFPDIPTNILQNFPDIAKKIHGIFAEIQNFFYDIKFFQKSLCFARNLPWFLPDRKNLGGGGAPAHTPMVMGVRGMDSPARQQLWAVDIKPGFHMLQQSRTYRQHVMKCLSWMISMLVSTWPCNCRGIVVHCRKLISYPGIVQAAGILIFTILLWRYGNQA